MQRNRRIVPAVVAGLLTFSGLAVFATAHARGGVMGWSVSASNNGNNGNNGNPGNNGNNGNPGNEGVNGNPGNNNPGNKNPGNNNPGNNNPGNNNPGQAQPVAAASSGAEREGYQSEGGKSEGNHEEGRPSSPCQNSCPNPCQNSCPPQTTVDPCQCTTTTEVTTATVEVTTTTKPCVCPPPTTAPPTTVNPCPCPPPTTKVVVPPTPKLPKQKCNSGNGNGPEMVVVDWKLVNGVWCPVVDEADCDPGQSWYHNKDQVKEGAYLTTNAGNKISMPGKPANKVIR